MIHGETCRLTTVRSVKLRQAIIAHLDVLIALSVPGLATADDRLKAVASISMPPARSSTRRSISA